MPKAKPEHEHNLPFAGHYEAVIDFAEDNSVTIRAMHGAAFTAEQRFTPSQNLPLTEWLKSTTWRMDRQIGSLLGQGEAHIAYSHTDGLVRLKTAKSNQKFDPNKDEDLARLVRVLKRLSPMPRADEPVLPDLLPEPTPEQLANATRYLHPSPANGYSGQATRRASKSGRVVASKEHSLARLQQLRAALVAGSRK